MASETNNGPGWGAKLILLAFAVLFPPLLAELALRVYFGVKHKDISVYRPSFVDAVGATFFDRARFMSVPFLPYAPRPFDSRTIRIYRPDVHRVVTYTYSNNSWGFRSPEISVTKPPHTKRIVALGGSTTWDGPTNDDTWPSLLQKKLRECYGVAGEKIEVINMAVDASTSPMSFVWLSFLGVEFSPDLVISYDGVNDNPIFGHDGLTPDYRSVMRHFDDQKLPLQARLPRWAFHSYLVTFVSHGIDARGLLGYSDAWSAAYGGLLLRPPAPDPTAGIQYFERNLRLMRAVSREYGAQFLGATTHWVNPTVGQERQNQLLRQFFQRNDIPYVELANLLPHNDWSIHVDQVHWTPKGLNLVAEAFKDKIVSEDLLAEGEPLSRATSQGARLAVAPPR